ncbi:Peptidase propeptide and YPEB domain-containing protein [Bhargavaea ginsengi]|uniref:Peptidase propeptide and YPEB domain-containing protein n=1 Tax=Bhargavaea ginsengi TaxID=426757 RepID=A0A1H6UXA6_9BACL|nr:PepSY domain-containing protein [Bhargavaea ginsengi]SEI96286.1 Peptidase propeptide and YPEB domain-containing protein [Bhargavaea ginsengi]
MKKRWFIAPVAAGVLAFGGMAAFAEDTGKLAPIETAEAKVKQVTSGWISADQATTIALEAAGGGEVREMELDRDDREYEFEIWGESGEVDVKVDAKSGDVLKAEHDDQDDDRDDRDDHDHDHDHDDDDRQAAPDNLISQEEAIQIAKGKAGSAAKVIEAELDEDDGRWHYELELRDGRHEYEVDIDAENGNVINFEKDED